MWTWEIFRRCSCKAPSWLLFTCLPVQRCYADNPRTGCTSLSTAAVCPCPQPRCLCWEWKQEELKAQMLWNSFVEDRFRKTKPAVVLKSQILTNAAVLKLLCTFTPMHFFISCHLTTEKPAGGCSSVTTLFHLAFTMDSAFPEMGKRAIFCLFKYHLSSWLTRCQSEKKIIL